MFSFALVVLHIYCNCNGIVFILNFPYHVIVFCIYCYLCASCPILKSINKYKGVGCTPGISAAKLHVLEGVFKGRTKVGGAAIKNHAESTGLETSVTVSIVPGAQRWFGVSFREQGGQWKNGFIIALLTVGYTSSTEGFHQAWTYAEICILNNINTHLHASLSHNQLIIIKKGRRGFARG